MGLKLSYVGAFLGCSRHPDCQGTMSFEELLARGLADSAESMPCPPISSVRGA